MSGSLGAQDSIVEKSDAIQQLDKEIRALEKDVEGIQVSYQSALYDDKTNMVTLDDVVVFLPEDEVEIKDKKKERMMIFMDEVNYTYSPEINTVNDIPEFSGVKVSGLSADISSLIGKDISDDNKALIAVLAGDNHILNMNFSGKQTLDKERGVVNIETNGDVSDFGMAKMSFSVSGLFEKDLKITDNLNDVITVFEYVTLDNVKFHAHTSDFTDLVTRYGAAYGSTLEYMKKDLQTKSSKMLRKEDKSRADAIYADMVSTFYVALNEDKQIHFDLDVGKSFSIISVALLMGMGDPSVNTILESFDITVDFKAK